MLRVIQKMKIPVPKEIENQIKALGGGNTGGTTPPKTTPKKN